MIQNTPPPAPTRRREHLAIAATLVAGILFWPALIYGIYLYASYGFYEKAIPRHFEITDTVYEDHDFALLEGCGGVVFRLSPTTIAAIQERGLGFINQDLYGRDYYDRKDNESRYHQYDEWRKTPAPTEEGDRAYWMGVSCLTKDNKDLSNTIYHAIESRRAYYTLGHEMELLIIPDAGYIVLTYFG